MLRRGFIGSLAALFGFGPVAVASSTEPVRIKQRSRFVRVYGSEGAYQDAYINLDLVQSVGRCAFNQEMMFISFASGRQWEPPFEKNRHIIELFEQGLA